jgi:hypothetical protein
MSLVIEKDHLYRYYGESEGSGHKAEKHDTLTRIRQELQHAERLNKAAVSDFQNKKFTLIQQYRCKHFDGQPLVIKFFSDPKDLSSTNYFVWNDETYLLSERAASSIQALFNSGIATAVSNNAQGVVAASLVDGHQYEIIQNPDSYQLPAEHWAEWEDRGMARGAVIDPVAQEAVRQYRNVIHPTIWEYVNDLILRYPFVPRSDGRVRILEVGGGTGCLAEMIINSNFRQIEQYLILENNQKEVSEAKRRLSKCKNPKIAVVEQRDATVGDSFQQTNPNIIIASGLLTHFVLPDRQTALRVLDHLTRIAPPGCYLLIAGHAPSYICSDDLIARGWEVRNTYSPSSGIPFYVAVRRG